MQIGVVLRPENQQEKFSISRVPVSILALHRITRLLSQFLSVGWLVEDFLIALDETEREAKASIPTRLTWASSASAYTVYWIGQQ
jgi:hypothetical protein